MKKHHTIPLGPAAHTPGDILREEFLEPMEISMRELARKMGFDELKRGHCHPVFEVYNKIMIQSISELQKLPIHERLQLVEDLWNSIALEDNNVPVRRWQIDELDRRAERFDANPSSGIPWETVKDVIRGQHA